MMATLKPCPFCGSDAVVFEREDDEFPYRVQCINDDCSCRTDDFVVYKSAINTWNRRVQDEQT